VREVLPGIWHWTAIHPRIHIEVSSFWLDAGGVLIDPLPPPDIGLDWFADRPQPPAAIILSNRHHYRGSGAIVERFGVPVFCNRAGLHEFGHREPVTGFDPGDELPGGLRAIEVGGICPDDTGLFLPGARALWFADAVVLGGPHGQNGLLGFVPDGLMDDPPDTKRAMLDAFARSLHELEFDHVLLAHGGPIVGGGRQQLQDLVDAGGRTAFEM
jgi:glyoxylase-like metal-dependent hydrolase (beta-lactamase superfamily II)